MEINGNIALAMTIAHRFEILHTASQNASNALAHVRLNLFTDALSKEDEDILKHADKILNTLRSNTGYHDAQKYFKQLPQPITEP